MEKTCDVKLQMHLLELEITTRCNLNCLHCYNRGVENQDMPLEQIISLFEFASNKEIDTIVISGGEACLHPQFVQLCKYIIKNKNNLNINKIVIQSNGYIENISKDLIKAFDIVHLSFELDGSDVRVSSGDSVVNTAKKLNEKGIYAYLFTTIHAKNIDCIEKCLEIAEKSKVDIGFNICCDTGKNRDLLLSNNQKLEVSKKLLKLYKEGRILKYSHPFTSILENRTSNKYIGNRGGCTAGIATCDILPNGDVIPCPFFRIVCGNINKDNLEKIWWDSNILKVIRNRNIIEGKCNSCKHLSYCGGCRKTAFEQTGKINGSDPTCFKNIIEYVK